MSGSHPWQRRCAALVVFELSAVAPAIELHWDAPPGCPDRAAVAAEIDARIGASAGAAHIDVDARVVAQDDGAFAVDVTLRGDASGHRHVRAASCEEAATAAAVVVAIAANGDDGPVIPEAPIPPAPTVPAASTAAVPAPVRGATVPTPTPAAEPAAPRRIVRGLALSGRAAVDAGTIAGVAPIVAGVVELYGDRWHAWLGGLYRFARALDARDAPALGGRFRMAAGQLGAGPRLRWGAFELPLRAAMELGAITGRGTGALLPRDSRRLWAAALIGAGASWAPRPRLALELGVEAVVPLVRPRFRVGAIPIATVGPIGVRAWLGLSVRFSFEESPRAGKRRNRP